MQLNNFNSALENSMGAQISITTPKKSTLPMIEMPTERLSASTASGSGRASRYSNLTANPLSEERAKIKTFFSGRSHSSEELKEYDGDDKELNRYNGVVHFLKKARVVAERQASETRAHQKKRAIYLYEERRVDQKVKIAVKKAEKTLERMKSENARCQAILDQFRHWDIGLKNYC